MADKKPIKITETVLRDAHQSLIATRMTTEQMLPIIDKMDKVGYHSVECWAVQHLMHHSDSLRRIHGRDSESSEMDSRIQSCRCSSEDRISSDTVIMQMML